METATLLVNGQQKDLVSASVSKGHDVWEAADIESGLTVRLKTPMAFGRLVHSGFHCADVEFYATEEPREIRFEAEGEKFSRIVTLNSKMDYHGMRYAVRLDAEKQDLPK